MAFRPFSYPKFNRIKKKLPEPLRLEIDDQVNRICENPTIGKLKTGDLKNVRIHKFTHLGQLYLLAYTVDETDKVVYLLAIGGHENFYRDLKRYLKT
ncbi:MAG: type II toxin-antitoxin system RelE/ParE family toxin [Candidatus Bipolaricaulota bacterium]|nr:type II toxin-antitoxin system RelE/ParE family toxin [Candidatus Bipolaricaulota bacterium]